jgi:hypothetical protein
MRRLFCIEDFIQSPWVYTGSCIRSCQLAILQYTYCKRGVSHAALEERTPQQDESEKARGLNAGEEVLLQSAPDGVVQRAAEV